VFLHGGLRCERAWVEPVDPFLSDHRPVVAELVAT
jgi:endonuclease/exonuclease/phosphatase (EEP) superfamily protein YafD